MIERRTLIKGLISLVAAPAIVRYQSIMPVKVFDPVWSFAGWGQTPDGRWHHLAEVDGTVYYDGRLAVIGDRFPFSIHADVGNWNRALSPREIGLLADGWRPPMISRKLVNWCAGAGIEGLTQGD